MGKWIKQLRREIKKNPGKAAGLGVLCIVALVLWGPRLVHTKAELPSTRTVAEIAGGALGDLAMLGVKNSPSGEDSEKGEEKWKKLATWWEIHTASVYEGKDLRDPFARFAVATVVDKTQEKNDEARSSMSLQSIVRCTGVVVGPKRRWVILDGRGVPEGGQIRIRDKNTEFVVRVVSVLEDKVVFDLDGKPGEYPLPKLGLSLPLEE